MNTIYHWLKTIWRLKAYIILLLLSTHYSTIVAAQPDTALASQIRMELQSRKTLPLYFPKSVKRFYTSRNFKPVWLISEKGEAGHAWQAMVMLDCVLQYGLSHADYHPDELNYGVLHDILQQQGKVSLEQQSRFEIMLTDAMLTLMVHLHYGKLNPELPATKIDAGYGDMRMEAVLTQAVRQPNIEATLLAVQPKGEAYTEMQHWMHKWKGQYLDDCYEIPEANVRKVAINMERLRWAAIGAGKYMQVNIPSFRLSLFLPDKTYQFKVVTGKPSTPTPLLHSRVGAIDMQAKMIWPDQLQTVTLVPQNTESSMLRFAFSSRYKVALTEIKETNWFNQKQRALTTGDIGVEKAERLAMLLLQADHQQNKTMALRQGRLTGSAVSVKLRVPIPIKVTYITCWFQDAQLMTYPDIYQLDNQLEQAIYHERPKKLSER
ncbi:hypothetical protein ACFS5N_10390 [Mucilaginibacter ximonensis]|uniref:L,D-transpeptidase scaffold domain-containing protein n=1 Tax=Mucilaginibacter ximonensis TaxID=538021 RepID=A0ABW5YC58_9SPHI